jgi:hypothetical protein
MPVVVMKFRKTNGVRSEIAGVKTYELHYQAEVELPHGFLPRPKSIWEEMQRGAEGMMLATKLGELMTVKITSQPQKLWEPHSLSGNGRVYFRKTERGWEGYDGQIY